MKIAMSSPNLGTITDWLVAVRRLRTTSTIALSKERSGYTSVGSGRMIVSTGSNREGFSNDSSLRLTCKENRQESGLQTAIAQHRPNQQPSEQPPDDFGLSFSRGQFAHNCFYFVVPGGGLEPSRGLRPNGFSYHLRLSPPAGDRVLGTLRQVCGLDYTFAMAVRPAGAARLVSTPSPPESSVGAWLGIAILQGSPNLSSSASPVSRRALKLRLSPVRLPIPPRPRYHLKDKA
jgi:hypothetical protein